MDQDLPDVPVAAVSLSDFNRALAMQGKPAVTLADDQYCSTATTRAPWVICGRRWPTTPP